MNINPILTPHLQQLEQLTKQEVSMNINPINKYSGLLSVSYSLDPDQAQHFVGPDLGTNVLQKL